MDGIARILAWESAESFLAWLSRPGSRLDILFLDLGLPGMGGLDLLARLAALGEEIPIIVLSSISSERSILSALSSGAAGYILKEELGSLPEIVSSTLAGGANISPTIAARLVARFLSPVSRRLPAGAAPSSAREDAENSAPESLTERETEVLERIAEGMSEQEAAKSLGISLLTVRTHVKRIYRKLYVSNRATLIRRARELGILG